MTTSLIDGKLIDRELIDSKEVAVRSISVMADGDLEDFRAVVHPLARNRESVDEPPATRGHGPEAFYATALWLRGAYAELRWDIDTVVAEGDLVAVHGTMSGRHVGPFVSYGENAEPAKVFPPTGKTFATTQSHWFRIADGKVIEHWANRDDLGTSRSWAGCHRRRCISSGCCWRCAGPGVRLAARADGDRSTQADTGGH